MQLAYGSDTKGGLAKALLVAPLDALEVDLDQVYALANWAMTQRREAGL